jgi:hypothetical protein
LKNFRKIHVLFLACAVLLAAVVLYIFPPIESPFYPRCIVYSLTGLQCPGCGTLRALHRLLHGDVYAAFQFNPLLIGLIPVFGFAGFSRAARSGNFKELFTSSLPARWIWLLLAGIVAFTIARNIPFERFAS